MQDPYPINFNQMFLRDFGLHIVSYLSLLWKTGCAGKVVKIYINAITLEGILQVSVNTILAETLLSTLDLNMQYVSKL